MRGVFLDYWNAFGGLSVFGYPLTEPFEETDHANGQTYTVQYFERNRFEYHPENGARYQVLLGRLGAEALDALGARVAALPTVAPPEYAAGVTPVAAVVGTVFTARFVGLHANGTYTIALYDESHGGRIVNAGKFGAGTDGTLAVDIDSVALLPGFFHVAAIDSKDDEIASVRFEVLAGGH